MRKIATALWAPLAALMIQPAAADYIDDIQKACLFRMKTDDGGYVGMNHRGDAIWWPKTNDGTQDFLIQPWFGPFAKSDNELSSVPYDNSLIYVTIANEAKQGLMSWNWGLGRYQTQAPINNDDGAKWVQVFGLEYKSGKYRLQNREMKDDKSNIYFAGFGPVAREPYSQSIKDKLRFKLEKYRCKNPPRGGTGRELQVGLEQWGETGMSRGDRFYYEGSKFPIEQTELVGEEYVSFLRINDPKARSGNDVFGQYNDDPYYVLSHFVTVKLKEIGTVDAGETIEIKEIEGVGEKNSESRTVTKSMGWEIGGEMGNISGGVSGSVTQTFVSTREAYRSSTLELPRPQRNPKDGVATLFAATIIHTFQLNRNDYVKRRGDFRTPAIWRQSYVEEDLKLHWIQYSKRPTGIVGVGTGVKFE